MSLLFGFAGNVYRRLSSGKFQAYAPGKTTGCWFNCPEEQNDYLSKQIISKTYNKCVKVITRWNTIQYKIITEEKNHDAINNS